MFRLILIVLLSGILFANDSNETNETNETNITIGDIDTAFYTQTTTNKLSLEAGWNLVALPVDITITQESYSSYFGDDYQIYKFDGKWIKNPTTIRAGEGFWVFVGTSRTVSFEGEPYGIDEKLYNLSDGWHLVGSGTKTLLSSFASPEDNITIYEANSWSQATPTYVEGGRGFWIIKKSTTPTITTLSNTPTPSFDIVEQNSTIKSSAHCTINSETLVVCSNTTLQEATQEIGKNLFLDDKNNFVGVIDSVEQSKNTINYHLTYATKVKDIYNQFDIELSGDELQSSIYRTVSQMRGKYDYLNSQPLKFSVVPKYTTNSRSVKKDQELIVRIDFPQGYYIPIEHRGVECDFWEASCDASFKVEQNKRFDLGHSEEKSGITISTEGSFVAFGIGSYMRAKYDKNLLSEDTYAFEFKTSAYFESNISFSIRGNLDGEWTKTIDLTRMYNIEIRHPYSLVAKVVIGLQPTLELGVSGEVEVGLNAKAYSKREGEIGIYYSSTANRARPYSKISFTTGKEDGISYHATVNGEAFIAPRIVVRPKLIFLRVAQALSFGDIRGGIKINSILTGEVNGDFLAINKGFNESVEDAKVGVDLGVFAIVDYILQIRLGKKEFWAMDEYEKLYTSKRLKFFDWMISLLEDPKCQEVEGGILLSTDNEHSKYIQYYYQMVDYGSKEYNGTLADMINFSHNAQKLVGNTLALDQNKTLYIQAMLKNSSEISDAIFAGGTSLSKVITCNYPQNPTSPLDEENITRPIPPITPPESIDPPPPPFPRDETCDLWDIRYANWQGADCSIKEDMAEQAKCETYNECVSSIQCITTWDDAQAKLDACTLQYLGLL